MSRAPPRRHWRSYGNDPLPTGAEAMDEPFAAFPSWFLRIECDRCGKVQMINEAHFARPNMPIRAILAKMRHDGCGGRAETVELLSGIEGVSSRPVRRIVLREG
jgi:ribosomal protein S27E